MGGRAEHPLMLGDLEAGLARFLGDRGDRVDGPCHPVEHLALDLQDAVDDQQRDFRREGFELL
jgi:hypothetical protein